MLLPVALLFSWLALAACKKQLIVCETCVMLGNVCHNISYVAELKANFRKDVVITKMGLLRSINRLYYAYEPEISDPEYNKIAFVDLDDPNNYGVLNGTKAHAAYHNFGTFAIDQNNEKLYLGSSDGIYTLDKKAGDNITFFSSSGETIKSIFYKGNVFFVSNDVIIETKPISESNNEFVRHEYFDVKNFVIDNNNNIVLLNTTGLYGGKFKTGELEKLSINSFFRGLTMDLEGNVYAWWIDTIYRVVLGTDVDNARLVKLGDIEGLGSMAFDNNNELIFTSGKGLFRLVPTIANVC